MTKHFPTRVAATAVLTLVAGASPALAGVTKTWVSSTTGDDAGTCQFTTPCKTFAFAITQTLPGGEIDVKDGGSYGPVTISQAVSIVNQGFLAAISVPSGGVGITINAGDGDKVIIQGLVIDGHGSGKDGIDFNSGATLSVKGCDIRNVSSDGIFLGMQGSSQYYIAETEVQNARGRGIVVSTYVGPTSGAFSRINLHGNATGIDVALSSASLTDSTISENGIGILLVGGGALFMASTTVSSNTSDGIDNQSGTLASYGNNYINGNKVDILGSISPVGMR